MADTTKIFNATMQECPKKAKPISCSRCKKGRTWFTAVLATAVPTIQGDFVDFTQVSMTTLTMTMAACQGGRAQHEQDSTLRSPNVILWTVSKISF